MRSPRRTFALVALSFVAATAARAQQSDEAPRLVVRVLDQAGAPLPQVTVTVRGDSARGVRAVTGDSGIVRFRDVPRGSLAVFARRIGLAPDSLVLAGGRTEAVLRLRRTTVTTLETVRVAGRRSVSGIVASAAGQEPIAGALVTVVGTNLRTTTAADGSFSLPLEGRRGGVTLLVRHDGYAPVARAERIPARASGNYLVLLESSDAVDTREASMRWDMARRMAWRGLNSATIGERELLATGAPSLLDALRESPSRSERGLRFADAACLFVDGEPRPGQSLQSFPTEEARLVEVYDWRSDRFTSLGERWPAGAPCGQTESVLPATTGVRGEPGVVSWVVVWTR